MVVIIVAIDINIVVLSFVLYSDIDNNIDHRLYYRYTLRAIKEKFIGLRTFELLCHTILLQNSIQ